MNKFDVGEKVVAYIHSKGRAVGYLIKKWNIENDWYYTFLPPGTKNTRWDVHEKQLRKLVKKKYCFCGHRIYSAVSFHCGQCNLNKDKPTALQPEFPKPKFKIGDEVTVIHGFLKGIIGEIRLHDIRNQEHYYFICTKTGGYVDNIGFLEQDIEIFKPPILKEVKFLVFIVFQTIPLNKILNGVITFKKGDIFGC